MKLASAILAAAIVCAMSPAARAADIKVISGGAFKQVLNALAAQYQTESGNKLDITYQTVGQHLALIRDGKEAFDVAVLTPEAIDGLAKEGKVVSGSRADLAKTGVGVVVKAGTPLPDISTVDAFKRTLLAAKSVGYSDGPSGAYIVNLFERLGIAEAMKPKAKLTSRLVAEIVAEGEAEVGMQQIVAILPVKGAELVGPLPSELQNIIVYAAGLAAGSAQSGAARTFIAFMTMPEVTSLIRAKGMEPGVLL